MKKYALFGKSIENSYSPIIHRAIGEYYNLDIEYEVINCDSVKDIVKHIESGKYSGANVTMPFKVEMLDKVDRLMPSAESSRALNTIKITEDGTFGYNTDFKGFLDVLNTHTYSVKNKNVMVYGTGGAARAVINALIIAGAKTIVLDGRNAESKFKVYKEFLDEANGKMTVIYGSHGLVSDLVVNASSVGMYSNQGLSIDLELMDTKAVFDMVYRPNKTELIKMAKEMDLEYFTGLEMLICQAVRSFYIWNSELNREKIDIELCKFAKKKVQDFIGEEI